MCYQKVSGLPPNNVPVESDTELLVEVELGRIDEQNGEPGVTRPGGPAGPVDVALRGSGNLKCAILSTNVSAPDPVEFSKLNTTLILNLIRQFLHTFRK